MVKCYPPIEVKYYSSKSFPGVCYWRGKLKKFSIVPEELKKNYRNIHPMRNLCQEIEKKSTLDYP